jgi:hypothetical protein
MKTLDMGVAACRFKVNEHDLWDYGLAIMLHTTDTGDVKIIVDRNYRIVEGPIWTFNVYPAEGCINFDFRRFYPFNKDNAIVDSLMVR